MGPMTGIGPFAPASHGFLSDCHGVMGDASPRVLGADVGHIERNGGVLEDGRSGKLRFWVPTS